ncbi:unnamed protein product [Mytilus edulis]|uniref:Uncharacterized protein n=1 Tax=Mytilus edulis TaxID=6550 RepID=A0A8S3RP64_MYTED|nr:unnamed protein product [Mytilus edulis]
MHAKAMYEKKEQTYLALQEKHERVKSACVAANIATAGSSLLWTVITGGVAGPLACVFQSSFTMGSICGIALTRAMSNLDSAKQAYHKSSYELQLFHNEKMELQNECEKLQSECDQCRKDKQNLQDEHDHLIGSLSNTALLFTCLSNCRHFISILQGRTEILQEARKDIVFQDDLRLPLKEIIKHLSSTSSLNLNNISDTQQLCENLSGQIKLMTKSLSNFGICDE